MNMTKEWFSVAELTAERLPGYPSTKSAFLRLIERRGWDRASAYYARDRIGEPCREYNYKLLGLEARVCIADRYLDISFPEPKQSFTEAWKWLNEQPESIKNHAYRRWVIVSFYRAVNTTLKGSWGSRETVDVTAARYKISPSTLYELVNSVCGISERDWLPALAPRSDQTFKFRLSSDEPPKLNSNDLRRRNTKGALVAFALVGAIAFVWLLVIMGGW